MIQNPNCVSCSLYPVLCDKVENGNTRLAELRAREATRKQQFLDRNDELNMQEAGIRLHIIANLARLGIMPVEELVAAEDAQADRSSVLEARQRLDSIVMDLTIDGIEIATQTKETADLAQTIAQCQGITPPTSRFRAFVHTVMGAPCSIFPQINT